MTGPETQVQYRFPTDLEQTEFESLRAAVADKDLDLMLELLEGLDKYDAISRCLIIAWWDKDWHDWMGKHLTAIEFRDITI